MSGSTEEIWKAQIVCKAMRNEGLGKVNVEQDGAQCSTKCVYSLHLLQCSFEHLCGDEGLHWRHRKVFSKEKL